MMNQIMVDLETLDNTHTSVILAIGAVRFDLDALTVDNTGFYENVSAKDCQRYGLTIGADTVRWWMQQSDEARTALIPAGRALPEALNLFRNFCLWTTDLPVIWGNGSTFDNMILRHAFVRTGIEYPTPYYKDLCYRTMKTMVSWGKKPERGTKHNALEDAKYQANHLIEIVRWISEKHDTTKA